MPMHKESRWLRSILALCIAAIAGYTLGWFRVWTHGTQQQLLRGAGLHLAKDLLVANALHKGDLQRAQSFLETEINAAILFLYYTRKEGELDEASQLALDEAVQYRKRRGFPTGMDGVEQSNAVRLAVEEVLRKYKQ